MPTDAKSIAELAEKYGYDQQLRKIARYEVKGLQAAEIVTHLTRRGEEWSLADVLYLMGDGNEGTASERAERKRRYEEIREQVRIGDIVDVDAQLKEYQSSALEVLHQSMMNATSERDRASIAKIILNLSGVGADRTERKIFEIRMPEEVKESLQALMSWIPPEGELEALIEVTKEPDA